AAMRPAQPTAPVPKMAIDVPASGRISLSTAPAPVLSPQPRGPRSSSGASLSTTTTLFSTTLEYVAKEDWPKKWEPTASPFLLKAVLPSRRWQPNISSKAYSQYIGSPLRQ